MKREAKMILFSDGARGIYIPKHFAESVKRECVSGIVLEDLDYLARGPNDIEAADGEPAHNAESYWDTWADVCDHAIVTDPDGTVYTLHQDGDLWLVEQGAIFNEHGNRDAAPDIDCMFYIDDGQEKLWFQTSSGRIEIQLTLEDALSGSQPGQDASEDITALRKVPYIAEQLDKIDADILRAELAEYGAWEEAELADHDTNLQRILWLACGDIKEQSQS